ncbi:MAG: LysM peptidoglycan-binding domain-containing protein [Ardenticatenaceae bacterium]|nr:LysM peptidoglycan-binding domain-containing protein [Ardenticatenaceae bacterium]
MTKRSLWHSGLAGLTILLMAMLMAMLTACTTAKAESPAPAAAELAAADAARAAGAATAAAGTPAGSATPTPILAGEQPPALVPTPTLVGDGSGPPPAGNPAAAISATPVYSVSYTIQSGDTLYQLALDYNTDLADILALNNLSDGDTLAVGQVVHIPLDGPPAAGETSGESSPPAGPPPGQVNGIPYSSFVILPDNVRQNARAIYARGQELGNNPRAFSKMGDSTIEPPHFLTRFDSGPYNLGDYAYLQDVIDYFAGSFGRESIAVRRGLHAWSVDDPLWADKTYCQANETVLACEFRLHKPSLLLIRLGSNDVGVPESFRQSMGTIVQYAIDNGVIPVLGTKADRNEGGDINNAIIREIAAQYQVPLWDFDAVANTIPGRGLSEDNVHMTFFYSHDYTDPTAFQTGHGVHNLTALILLDELWKQVLQ